METVIVLGIVAAIIIWAIGMYNNLVNLRNRVRNAFSQIDVQLTRRYDLIPNLVEAVKGYMAHERGTLGEVIQSGRWRTSRWVTPDFPRQSGKLAPSISQGAWECVICDD